jgi:hypothetical protein
MNLGEQRWFIRFHDATAPETHNHDVSIGGFGAKEKIFGF